MIRRRRLEITVEASRRLVVHRQDGIFEARCRECAGQVVFPDEAIVLAGISSREIHRLVEAGWIHFSETSEGLLFVCLDSLQRRNRL